MRGLIVIGLAAAALWLAAPAHASHISCGQTITTDTVLDSDLTCATKSALIVGGPDVTIDLNGHEIVAAADCPTACWGIRAPTDRTIVTNGVIRGFDTAGVQIVGDDAVIEGVTFRENHFGIDLIEAERGSVKDNEFDRNHEGVSLFSSNGSGDGAHVVEGNLFTGAASVLESGVGVSASTGNRIVGNTMTGIDQGIFLNEAVGTRVADNQIDLPESASAQLGVFLVGYGPVSNNVIVDNEIRGGAIGVWYSATGTGGRVGGNTITGSEIGIYWDITAADMRIEDNTIGEPQFMGIYLTWQESTPHPEHHLTVARNRITGSGLDGIYVEENPGQILLDANLVSGSADDGIETRPFEYAEAPQPALVNDNSASSNGDWGIIAASAASDGGGNRAWSNGQPFQCLRVVCGPGPPASLSLSPEAATNTAGDRHCVTATVADPDGRPTPEIVVRFSVDSGEEGSVGSDASGQSEFCYDGPLTPRSDAISAYADTDGDGAQGPGEPADSASKAWVLPASSDRCRVRGTGSIVASNGDAAAFRINAHVHNERSRGSLFYEDGGPADSLVLRSSRMSSLNCTGSSASVFGRTHGSAPLSFRIDVVDAGASGDSYRIRVSNGYDSGAQPLTSGNIWVH